MKKQFLGLLMCIASQVCAASRAAVRHVRYIDRIEEAKQKRSLWGKLKEDVAELADAVHEESLFDRKISIALWKAAQKEQDKKDETAGRYAHLYPEPGTWDTTERFSLHDSAVRIVASRTAESSMFDRANHIVDRSVVDLGKEPSFKEFLLPSALISQGVATNDGLPRQYVSDLKDTTVRFTSRLVHEEVMLTFAQNFFEGMLTLGMAVPYVAAQRTLDYTVNVSNVTKETLEKGWSGGTTAENAQFTGFYGNSADLFLKDILARKGMTFKPEHRSSSFGDITFFGHAVVPWQRVERVQTGAYVIAPYAKKTDHSVFYPASLGNGGFIKIGGHLNVLLKKKWGGYPHLSVKAEFGVPATVKRRVAQIVTTKSGEALDVNLAMVGLATTPTGVATLPESTIPAFAQGTEKITIRPGTAINGRLGMLFDNAILREMQIDCAYECECIVRDRLHGGATADTWDLAPFTKKPTQLAHRLHVALSYQQNDSLHWHAGGYLTLYGTSTPQRTMCTFGASYQW